MEICTDTNAMEVEGRHVSKIGNCCSRNNKVEYSLDSAADPDGDQHVKVFQLHVKKKSAASKLV